MAFPGQPVDQIGTDEAGATGDNDRTQPAADAGGGKIPGYGLANGIQPAVAQGSCQKFRAPGGIMKAEMIMPGVEPQALLNRHGWRQVLQRVPVDSLDRCAQRFGEPFDLSERVMTPRGIAGFGDPQGEVGVVRPDCLFDFRNKSVPARPRGFLGVPRSRKAMQTDDVSDAQYAPLTHQRKPVDVG